MATTCSIGIAQAEAVLGDPEQNLVTLDGLVADAAEAGAEVVVTPELFATGYAPKIAGRFDGEELRRRLAKIAVHHEVALVASTVDADPSPRGGRTHRIAASFFTPDGTELARTHKGHLFGPEEKAHFDPGENLGPVFEWAGFTCAMGVCYDIEFPEFARLAAVHGVDLLFVPTAVPEVTPEDGVCRTVAGRTDPAWTYEATATSLLQVPARALENGLVVAYANHCGAGFTGNSCLATPVGKLAAHIPDEEGTAVVTVEKAAIERARSVNTYLADLRRPAAFVY